MNAMKKVLIAASGAGALLAVVCGPAMATPVFTIDPNALVSTDPTTAVQATDLNITSDSVIQQTSPTTQTETGVAQASFFLDNGTIELSSGVLTQYNLFIDYTANVSGITSTAAGETGTIAPGGFTYELIASLGTGQSVSPGSTTGTLPSIAGSGTQEVLAIGSSLNGSAGFQSVTDAPTIDALSSFIICDGTVNQGVINGKAVTATGCGSYDALAYFTQPVPFYDVSFVSATAGSANDLTCNTGDTTCTLNNVAADVNFTTVPEPQTLAIFGFGLIGLGWAVRRRYKKT